MDPDGKDIIVLLDSNGARVGPVAFGHAAVLIGNDNDGWLYYSNDGKASVQVQWFSTKEDFFDSYPKTRVHPFNYDESMTVQTDSEQDIAMQEKAFELAGIETKTGFDARETGEKMIIGEADRPSAYNLFSNNCSEHVGIIAEAGGLYSTSDVIPKLQWVGTYDDYLRIYGNPYTNF